MYFTHYWHVVIILFNMGFIQAHIFYQFFWKTSFCRFELFVFPACSVSNLM